MNNSFPLIISRLRKEKGVSQKKAAEGLGISQALLSHYEKGIRECGLDFLIKAADYYNVSCDYLLGRTSERGDGAERDLTPAEIELTASKIAVVDSIQVIYELLRQYGDGELSADCTEAIGAAIYNVFRAIYPANGDSELFRYPDNIYRTLSGCVGQVSLIKAVGIAVGKPCPLPKNAAELEKAYPEQARSLLNIIRSVEERMSRCSDI